MVNLILVCLAVVCGCQAFVSVKPPLRNSCMCNEKKSFEIMSSSSRVENSSRTALENATPCPSEWDVKRYQSQHSFVWEFGSSLVDLLDPQPGERILDVGCGSGELTQAIAERQPNATVMGMDFDNGMVEQAKMQYPNLTFFQGDVCHLELDDHAPPFDAIFSNAALHWVLDAERAVEQMFRALKPGGRFVVEFGGKDNVKHLYEALQTISPIQLWYFPSIGEYSTLLEKHGIEVLSASLFDRPTPLDEGENGVSNWVRMFGSAFLEDLTEEEIEEALEAMQVKLRPHLFNGKQWVADYRRIRVVGRKRA